MVQKRAGQVSLNLGFPSAVRQPPLGTSGDVHPDWRQSFQRPDWHCSGTHVYLPQDDTPGLSWLRFPQNTQMARESCRRDIEAYTGHWGREFTRI